MSKRYLKILKKEEALKEILNYARPLGEELIPTREALGRMTSKPVYGRRSNPPFLCAAVDGYAVSFEKTLSADLTNPVSLKKGIDCYEVNTGDRLKRGFDAVIMVEDAEEKEEEIIIRKSFALWENVRMVGEDVIEGDLLLPPNKKVEPFDIGLLLSAGVTHIYVKRRPKILFIPTGEELFDPYEEEKEEGLCEFNSYTIIGLLEKLGVLVERAPIVRDKPTLKKMIEERIENFDILLLNAGTSAGRKDFTVEAIEELGRVVFHGVNMMPGKPTLFGIIKDRPLFGLPGYPASAILSLETFVLPFIENISDISLRRKRIEVINALKLPSRIGMEEVIRVNLIEREGSFYAFPLPRGASLISSFSFADGLIRISENVEGLEEEERIECELLKEEEEIKRRINIIGSHDLSLDLLRVLIKEKDPASDLFSIHTGSLGGLFMLKRGITSLATIHLFDEEEASFNIPFIKRFLPQLPLLLVHIAKRKQGLLVKKGNPKGIKDIKDLKRADVKFVNRQKGSGTRVLFDYLLKKRGIEGREIRGYEKEETSHTAVALLIKEDVADCGFGIMAVAKIFSLDFIPFFEEEYDLAVRKEFTKDRRFDMLMEVLSSLKFKKMLEECGGYDTAETGRIKYACG